MPYSHGQLSLIKFSLLSSGKAVWDFTTIQGVIIRNDGGNQALVLFKPM